MSQSRCFSLLGDSNIRNIATKTNCRANPVLQSAQIIPCGHRQLLAPALEKVRAETTVCILSCLTNFLTSAEGPSNISQRIEPVLQDVLASLHDQCSSHPDRFYMISPPMYRVAPIWYREGLSEILAVFSQLFNSDKPDNLILLPSFATPAFEADGVHLTPYSGLEFVFHLFDSTQIALENLSLPIPAIAQKSCEANRVLEDRVMVLEQDHRRLGRIFEFKTAADAELFDFRENERFEDYFVISGLPRISDDLVGKAWQDQAVRDVQVALRLLMGREYPIIVVHNSTKRVPNAEVTYTVRLANVQDSKSIRTKFGTYFVGGDKRPKNIKHLSIKNRVTHETRVSYSDSFYLRICS